MGNVLNAEAIKHMIDTSKIGGVPASFIKRLPQSVSFVTDDKKTINQLCMNADFLLTLYQYQFKAMKVQRARAISLIQILNKEYRLQ
jgi:hypothetical protein